MTAVDVDPASAMVLRGDWGDRSVFLRFAVDYPSAIPLVAEVDGEVVGTGTGTANGSVGWVGGIFVDPGRRRSGIGTAITRLLIDRLTDAGCRSIVLVASDEGRRIYERLGFEVQTFYEMFATLGVGLPGEPTGSSVADDELAAMKALDSAATGEDRAGLLSRFATPSTVRLAVTDSDGVARVGGFAVRAPWGGWATIAPDAAAGLALLEARRRATALENRVTTGLPLENEEGRSRLVAAGWTARYRATRMVLGDFPAWRPESIWGQFGMAVG